MYNIFAQVYEDIDRVLRWEFDILGWEYFPEEGTYWYGYGTEILSTKYFVEW